MYCWLYRVHKQYTAGGRVKLYVGWKARGCGWAVVGGGGGPAMQQGEKKDMKFLSTISQAYMRS
jgi:hypothetical protein